MRTFRKKTTRMIEAAFQAHGEMTVRELTQHVDREFRLLQKYLRAHPDTFEIKELRGKAYVWGLKVPL